jgi:hypothetical protein
VTNSITGVKITFIGGTDEEIEALTDAITYVLMEHGIQIGSMKIWDGPEE